MASVVFGCVTEGAVALSAGVAKSVLGVVAPAQYGVNLKKFRISFDGVTATAVPAVIELCYSTFATNSPGTASTTVTVRQMYGRSITNGFAAAKNWTTEPTVLTVLDEWLLTPVGGTVLYDFPAEESFDTAVSNGFVLRVTAPAGVNARGAFLFERC